MGLGAGVGSREPPVDRGADGVAPVGPGAGPPGHGVAVRQVFAQALPLWHGQFELGRVQPAAVLGVWWISSLAARRFASAGGKAAQKEAGDCVSS